LKGIGSLPFTGSYILHLGGVELVDDDDESIGEVTKLILVRLYAS